MGAKVVKELNFKPKAIICDMDGVIVDSMPYHFLAWYEALRPMGISVKCFDVYTREGEHWEKSLMDFLKGSGISPTKDIFKKVFLARKKLFKNRFKRFVFKGAVEFLICMKKRGYPLGLVTATTKEGVKQILPRKIEKLFDFIVTGDCVKKGKPNPEPYLKASKSLKIKPSECLVIENAPYGVTSAKRAGMFCVAITTSLPKEYLKGADIIADRLEEVATLIDKACPIVIK
ncbi:MAG: HAD family phosphatase [Candidatus Omnitrophota bacterium]|nr:HAD family phosphatase [Candidatus Omnitrophota bacterium]